MSVNKMNRLLWFVTFLSRQPYPISKRKIDEAWVENGFAENVIPVKDGESERRIMPRTTFYRLISAAQDVFGIDIIHTKDGWQLESKQSNIKKRLIDSIGVFGTIQGNPQLNKHIMIEDIPSGHKHLEKIMQAISDKSVISFHYERFEDNETPGLDEHLISEIKPYGLRLYDSRWYVIGDWSDNNIAELLDSAWYRSDIHNDQRLLARLKDIEYVILPLDRMADVKILPDTFEAPKDFDQEKLFKDFVGPYVDSKIPKQKVVIQAYGATALYIDSLPIHHSQSIVNETNVNGDVVIDFEYDLRPTYYFYKELLKFGSGVEVLSPDYARSEMRQLAEKILDNYL